MSQPLAIIKKKKKDRKQRGKFIPLPDRATGPDKKKNCRKMGKTRLRKFFWLRKFHSV